MLALLADFIVECDNILKLTLQITELGFKLLQLLSQSGYGIFFFF